MVRTILLIGPTQMGKSTLANFLQNGEVDPAKNKFEIGDGTGSLTQRVQSETVEYTYDFLAEEEMQKLSTRKEKFRNMAEMISKFREDPDVKFTKRSETYRIVDTPGVGDTRDSEAENMLNLYSELIREDFELSCAVLVVKFQSIINGAYKRNLLFYKNMLPEIFNRNVVIVVSPVGTDQEKQFKKSGKDIKETLANYERSFRDILELKHEVPVLTFDSMSSKDEEANWAQACSVRRLIFDRCLEIPSLKVSTLKFPKPISWQLQDEMEIVKLMGERTGVEKGLRVEASKLTEVSAAINLLQPQLDAARAELKKTKTELASMDDGLEVAVRDKAFKGDATWFWWTSEPFDFDVEYPISSCSVAGANVKYTEQSSHRRSGTISSNWFGALNATLTISTPKRAFYSEAISNLKSVLDVQRRKKAGLKSQQNSLLTQKNHFSSSLENLTQEHENNQRMIRKLQQPLSLSEINQRLQKTKLQQQTQPQKQ